MKEQDTKRCIYWSNTEVKIIEKIKT